MTKIKTARTTEGEKFYYLGHTQAVVNDAGDSIEDLLAEQDEKIELLNDNTGVSDYPEFSVSTTYKTGTIVKYEGALYKFTADHAAGIWDSGEVKAWNINAETQEKLSELQREVGKIRTDVFVPNTAYLNGVEYDKYIFNSGISVDYASVLIENVNIGDTYKIKGKGGVHYMLWATAAADGTIMRRSNKIDILTDESVEIQSGEALLIVNTALNDLEQSFVFNTNQGSLSTIIKEVERIKKEKEDIVLYTTEYSSEIKKRIKELYINGLDSSNVYYFKYFRTFISNDGTPIIQFYLYYHPTGSSNETLLFKKDIYANSFSGIVDIEGNGVSGAMLVDMDIDDTKNIQPILNNVVVSDISNSPTLCAYMNGVKYSKKAGISEVAESVPFVEFSSPLFFGVDDFNSGSPFQVSSETYATWKGSESSVDSYLTKLSFITQGWTIKIAIGIIDQRNSVIVRERYELPCTPFIRNDIDTRKYNIKVNEGETVFVVFDDASNSIRWGQWSSSGNIEMLYGSQNKIHTLGTANGGFINMSWELSKIDSMFALKSEVKEVNENSNKALSVANLAYSNNGILKDRNGNSYRAIVVDGSVALIPVQFKNVLVLGNSITKNPPVTAQGWYGNRGMAASRDGLDFVSHLESALRLVKADAIVIRGSLYEWETNLQGFDYSKLDEYFNSDIDCVIFRAGENVPSNQVQYMKEALNNLFSYITSKVPNAEIVLSSMVWSNSEIDNIILSFNADRGFVYADVAASELEYREYVGHYLEGEDSTLYKIAGAGVAAHPNDVGMLKIANGILSALKYQQLDMLHNVKVSNANGYSVALRNSQWVEGGIVNIRSNANNLVVRDSLGSIVSSINHNDGVFTFVMPNTDVFIITE